MARYDRLCGRGRYPYLEHSSVSLINHLVEKKKRFIKRRKNENHPNPMPQLLGASRS